MLPVSDLCLFLWTEEEVRQDIALYIIMSIILKMINHNFLSFFGINILGSFIFGQQKVTVTQNIALTRMTTSISSAEFEK